MSYDLVDRNRRLFSGRTLRAIDGLAETDRLNVCDQKDERAHGYRYSSRLGNLALNGTVRIDSYPEGPDPGGPPVVADAGRMIIGWESFLVRTRADRDLVLVMRTAGSAQAAVWRAGGSGMLELEVPEAAIAVFAGQEPAARIGLRPEPGWNETVIKIPAQLLAEGHTPLLLKGKYASYFYWFFQ
jgi:hypothetical protein